MEGDKTDPITPTLPPHHGPDDLPISEDSTTHLMYQSLHTARQWRSSGEFLGASTSAPQAASTSFGFQLDMSVMPRMASFLVHGMFTHYALTIWSEATAQARVDGVPSPFEVAMLSEADPNLAQELVVLPFFQQPSALPLSLRHGAEFGPFVQTFVPTLLNPHTVTAYLNLLCKEARKLSTSRAGSVLEPQDRDIGNALLTILHEYMRLLQVYLELPEAVSPLFPPTRQIVRGMVELWEWSIDYVGGTTDAQVVTLELGYDSMVGRTYLENGKLPLKGSSEGKHEVMNNIVSLPARRYKPLAHFDAMTSMDRREELFRVSLSKLPSLRKALGVLDYLRGALVAKHMPGQLWDAFHHDPEHSKYAVSRYFTNLMSTRDQNRVGTHAFLFYLDRDLAAVLPDTLQRTSKCLVWLLQDQAQKVEADLLRHRSSMTRDTINLVQEYLWQMKMDLRDLRWFDGVSDGKGPSAEKLEACWDVAHKNLRLGHLA